VSDSKCEWCGEPFTPVNKRGPKPKYCRDSHRRRAHEARTYERVAIGTIPRWMEATDEYVIGDPGWQHYRIKAGA
jgi:hypothetical protein